MKTTTMLIALKFLFLLWTSFPVAQAKKITLDMSEGSYNDMHPMLEMDVEKAIEVTDLKEMWENAKLCADEKSVDLKPILRRALCVYTNNTNKFYRGFNAAVRSGKLDKSFAHHIMHFLLTRAMQILNAKKECVTVYRRYKDELEVHEEIRFGSFASASKLDNQIAYGSNCLRIKTCEGAYIKAYSVFPEEEEVLIPPYEKFRRTESKDKIKDCKTVFFLESVGALSKHDKAKL